MSRYIHNPERKNGIEWAECGREINVYHAEMGDKSEAHLVESDDSTAFSLLVTTPPARKPKTPAYKLPTPVEMLERFAGKKETWTRHYYMGDFTYAPFNCEGPFASAISFGKSAEMLQARYFKYVEVLSFHSRQIGCTVLMDQRVRVWIYTAETDATILVHDMPWVNIPQPAPTIPRPDTEIAVEGIHGIEITDRPKTETRVPAIPKEEEEKNETLPDCYICYAGESCWAPSCGHIACKSCIDKYIQKPCPKCRKPITGAIKIFS